MITGSSSDGIDYAPNPEYNASDGPYLDGLRYQFYGSKDGMIAAFLAGELDLAFDMTQADYPAVAQVDPAIGRADIDPQWGYEHLDLNFMSTDVGLDDPLVRQAIAHAVDKERISSVLFPGAGVPTACSPAPPGIWYRVDDITCPEYDPEKAMALLDEAGWIDEGDGRAKDGVPLRMKMCTSSGNPTRLTTLGVVAQDLAAVGIPTDIQTEDAASVYFADWADTTPETQCSIYRGTYDIALFAWVFTGDLYSDAFSIYHSSQIPSDANPNGYNNTRLVSPEMDAALDTIGVSVDPEEQFESAATYQQVVIDTVTEIPLYYRSETTGVSNRVGGYERYNPSTAGATWDTERWFVQE
jgi:peptide/nickel transport system substrate-binding protein